jgi:Fe-S-cluster containining protein
MGSRSQSNTPRGRSPVLASMGSMSISNNNSVKSKKKIVEQEEEEDFKYIPELTGARDSINGIISYYKGINDNDEYSEVHRRNLIHDLTLYIKKWCFIFNKKEEELEIYDYKMMICSFIEKIINSPITQRRTLDIRYVFGKMITKEDKSQEIRLVDSDELRSLINNIYNDFNKIISIKSE